jgi:hypothetical protein
VSQHTPGPWTIRHEFNVMGPEGRLVAACGGHSNNRAVLAVDAENTANAHLIAAAPELLDALKLALPFVNAVYREHGRDYLPNSGDAQEQIAAAIAKAEPSK